MKPVTKFLIRSCLTILLLVNGAGFLAAYLMTHYQTNSGFGTPRSQNYNDPQDFGLTYITHQIPLTDRQWLHSWLIPVSNQQAKGMVLLFHGKDNNKSSLMDSAEILYQMGYHSMLVDFRGAGQSSGNKTTIGIEEGKDVAAAVDYLAQLPETYRDLPLILYGISMGSAAILEAIAEYQIQPDAIILELPFTTILEAVRARLRNDRLPPFPMAELIVFWGGLQHGFNGFAHQPIQDAKFVTCPTLVFAGERDRTVTLAQVKGLTAQIDGKARLQIFPDVGHKILAKANPQLWQTQVRSFLSTIVASKRDR